MKEPTGNGSTHNPAKIKNIPSSHVILQRATLGDLRHCGVKQWAQLSKHLLFLNKWIQFLLSISLFL